MGVSVLFFAKVKIDNIKGHSMNEFGMRKFWIDEGIFFVGSLPDFGLCVTEKNEKFCCEFTFYERYPESVVNPPMTIILSSNAIDPCRSRPFEGF